VNIFMRFRVLIASVLVFLLQSVCELPPRNPHTKFNSLCTMLVARETTVEVECSADGLQLRMALLTVTGLGWQQKGVERGRPVHGF